MITQASSLLVLIGAGHLPILRHAAQASPEVELVEPRAFIRGAALAMSE